jgi:hypothetical protein
MTPRVRDLYDSLKNEKVYERRQSADIIPVLEAEFGEEFTDYLLFTAVPSTTPSGHGTRTRYMRGCRCRPCTVANTEYQRWWKNK